MTAGLASVGGAWIVVGACLLRLKETRSLGGLIIVCGASMLALAGVIA